MAADLQLIFLVEFSHARGGMVRSVMTLIAGLSRNHRVSLVCPKGSEIALRMRRDCPSVSIGECQAGWVLDWRKPWQTWKTMRSISSEVAALRRPGPVLVITNNVGAELLAWGCGRAAQPRLFVARGGDYKGLSAVALRLALQQTLAIVSTTAQHRLKLGRLLGGDFLRKTFVIWNGINVEPLLTLPSPAFGNTGRVIRIGVIGFPSERKNQLLLVEAVALFRQEELPVECHFYGLASSPEDAVYEQKIRRRVTELRLESVFSWHGYVEDPVELYAGVDMVVSTALEEGFGRTIVEAMAAGRPVVALRCSGGPAELIRDGEDGILIENSPVALAAAIRELAANPVRCSRLAENGRIRAVGDFSEKKYVENYEQLLRELPLRCKSGEVKQEYAK